MRLKSLEIVGFKSFADPFRIDFRRGISSIVGPNGCGKSNVADAIRWVLGAQSPKQLRAERMESVIFSGSTRRKQLGMAEVTLTFDNCDRSLTLDYDEVSVSRRLFRSGDSEYSINGSKCRLMDITDLVVDRGLGSTGYWILESKMVGTILSTRPEDRRFLFDEAAGIVKYKIQRHRAELKLDSTASDLERLADIISEVESTCGGLKRQVSAYKKHERVTGSIKSLREAMNLIASTGVKRQLDEYSGKLDETGALVGKETASLAARSAVLAEAKTEYGRVQGRLDEAHRVCSTLDAGLAAADREAAVTQEKMEAAGTRIAENNARMARERERSELYRRDIEALQGENAALAPVVSDLEEQYRVSKDQQTGTVEKLKKARSGAERLRAERSSIERAIEDLQNRYLDGVRKEEARIQRLAWLEGSRKDLTERLNLLEERKIQLVSTRSELNEDVGRLEQLAADLRMKIKIELSSVEKLEEEESLAGRTIAVLEDQARRAEEALRSSSSPESISSIIQPLEGMGKALGAFLYGFDKAVPVETPEGLETDGSLYAQSPSEGHPPLPEGAVTLDECSSGTPGPVVSAILRRGILAPDRSTAVQWIRNGINMPVVTRDGDIFRPEGFFRLGVQTDSAGALELKQILDESRAVLDEKRKEQNATASELADRKASAEGLKASADEIREKVRLEEKELAGLDSTVTSTDASIESLQKELEEVEFEFSRLGEEQAAVSANSDRDEMEELHRKRDEAVSREDEITGEVSRLENLLSEMVRNSDAIQFRLREQENRSKEIQDRIAMLESEQTRIEELLQELSSGSSSSSEAIRSMKERLKLLKKDVDTLRDQRGEAEELRNSLSVERNRLMESTAVLEREVQQIRDRLGKAKSQMIELEAVSRSLKEKLEALEESFTTDENPYLDLSLEELENRLIEENGKLEKIGPVNMLAVKEYEESSRRLEYLIEQRNDLEQARASLSRAISEINEEAAERFRETFDKVRDNFQEMFRKLFGGGEGDIVSLEGEDPLEGGIEIMARPRGKMLKNVIALSEGEKAMTAVALLFSLYLVKPSPFCVLDELDGPFDDSNTDKFVAILREFSADTQFIVITHNKRTMEGSDVLYGITMAEEGVSTITSVNLEEMVNGS